VNAALDPFWERIEVFGVESTFNGYWFVDGLREQGRNVELGNPAKMEQYKGIKIANDLTDADWLAEQLRMGNATIHGLTPAPRALNPAGKNGRIQCLFLRSN